MGKVEQLSHLLKPSIVSLGFELWGIEFFSGATPSLLRIYIDSQNGITVDDCAAVSDQVGAVLEVEEVIPGDYTLEVSSPGIDRPLFFPDQYQRYLNHLIKVRLMWPEHGRRSFRGYLHSVSDHQIEIEMEGAKYVIALDAVVKAKVVDVLGHSD